MPEVDIDVEREYTLDGIAHQIHATAISKGFWEPDPVMMDKYMAKLALAHSEITEILEALRKNKGSQAVADEFSDAIIRLLDLWAALVMDGIVQGVMLDDAFYNKMIVNMARPKLHGHSWG
jgi:NTP pyrophosphatase (non-canonical NTP hydrolase)